MSVDLKPPRRVRIGTIVAVALIHVALAIGIIRAFTPELGQMVVDRTLEALTVIVSTPPPKPVEPEPVVKPVPDEGASAEEGKKAKPREVSAPKPVLPKKPEPMPPVSSTGKENASGAAKQGQGTGGGGQGTGTGSGQSGSGQGSGAVRGVEKIAGDINSAKDYPRKTREQRIGHSVTITVDVGTDGRVTGCRVTAPSPDPQADAITCQLATQRFRFRPATDRAGNPVPGRYAWRQRWYY